MSGLEAIGIVASISQLVQYSAKLIAILQDICQNDAQSGNRYRRQKLQVQQVIEIAELIRTTEGLQSNLIQPHLISLVETTKSIEEAIERTPFFAGSANKLQKCLRVLDVPKADSAISRGFDNLERDKSCLTLCLLWNFGSLIVGIQSNVKQIPTLQKQLEGIQQNLQDYTGIMEGSRGIQETTVVSSSEHGSCSSFGTEKRYMDDTVSQDGTLVNSPQLAQMDTFAAQEGALSVNERSDFVISEDDSDQTLVEGDDAVGEWNSYRGEGIFDETSGEHGSYDGGSTYSGIVACDQASQINGSFGFDLSDGPRGHSSWVNVRATGKSNQWNGDIKDANVLVGFFSPRGS